MKITLFKKPSFKWALVGAAIIIAAAIVAMTLPKDLHTSAAGQSEDYFPLRKGNRWVYHGTGNEYASFSREVLFTEGNLAQTLEINGGADVTKIFRTTSNAVTEIFELVEPSDPVNRLHEPANKQSILLRSPLAVGTKWHDGKSSWEIVDTAATIETPAGTFKNCIRIKSAPAEDSSFMYQYYAKGVGMVEQDFIFGGEKVVSSSLKSYHLVN